VTEIPLRELRNETSAVLRRVEEGERLTVTVSGRPVAQLVPFPRRRRDLTWEELVAVQADRGLLDDLREMFPETRDDSEDPWERAERRHLMWPASR
jgi:prevent-host-death family protein